MTGEEESLLRELLAAVDRGLAREAWAEAVGASDDHLDRLANWLVQEGYLRYTDPLARELQITDKAREMLRQWAPR